MTVTFLHCVSIQHSRRFFSRHGNTFSYEKKRKRKRSNKGRTDQCDTKDRLDLSLVINMATSRSSMSSAEDVHDLGQTSEDSGKSLGGGTPHAPPLRES